MTATMIDLDDEALDKARRYYGTTTKKDTVNSALRDAAAREDEKRTALGRLLFESVAEYERMTDEEKAEFRAGMDTTDHRFLSQVAAMDAAAEAQER
jgi:Arc/MetJ family transcription regulator